MPTRDIKKSETSPFPRHDPLPSDTIMKGLLQTARNSGREKSCDKLNQFIPNHLIFIYILLLNIRANYSCEKYLRKNHEISWLFIKCWISLYTLYEFMTRVTWVNWNSHPTQFIDTQNLGVTQTGFVYITRCSFMNNLSSYTFWSRFAIFHSPCTILSDATP